VHNGQWASTYLDKAIGIIKNKEINFPVFIFS
jgi:hypothetical protein